MAMRWFVGGLFVVLCLSRIVVFGQTESDLKGTSPAGSKEVVDVEAGAVESVPEPDFVAEGLRIWQEAIEVEVKKLGERDAEFVQRVHAALIEAEPIYKDARAAYEARIRREALSGGFNPFAPRRGLATREADRAGLLHLADTVDHLRQQLVKLKEKHDSEAVPVAWGRLSEDERQKIIKARALTPGEKIELSVDDVPLPPTRPHFVNSLGMNMIKIPTGSFKVVNIISLDERLEREISITNELWMSEIEVTREQYAAVIDLGEPKPGTTASSEIEHDPKSPVLVSWYDALRLCVELSKQASEKGEGRFYRLPTEAEWEYSCRAGTATDYSFGDRRDVEDEISHHMFIPGYTDEVNYDRGNAKLKVGGFYRPNSFGLYDMHGNAAEWTGSWWVKDYLDTCPSVNPAGPDTVVWPAQADGETPSVPLLEGKAVRGSVGMSQTGSSTTYESAFWATHGIRLVCEVGEASEITRSQYREFQEGESYGWPAAYEKALRDAVEIYRVRWNQLNSNDPPPAGQESLLELRKMPRRAEFAAELFSCLGRVYNQLKQPEMAQRAYKEVAKHRQYYLDAKYPIYERGSTNCADLHVRLAKDYIKAKDYSKAKRVLEKVIVVAPKYPEVPRLMREIESLAQSE